MWKALRSADEGTYIIIPILQMGKKSDLFKIIQKKPRSWSFKCQLSALGIARQLYFKAAFLNEEKICSLLQFLSWHVNYFTTSLCSRRELIPPNFMTPVIRAKRVFKFNLIIHMSTKLYHARLSWRRIAWINSGRCGPLNMVISDNRLFRLHQRTITAIQQSTAFPLLFIITFSNQWARGYVGFDLQLLSAAALTL